MLAIYKDIINWKLEKVRISFCLILVNKSQLKKMVKENIQTTEDTVGVHFLQLLKPQDPNSAG